MTRRREYTSNYNFERISSPAELEKLVQILIEDQIMYMARYSEHDQDTYGNLYDYFSKLNQAQYEKLVLEATATVLPEFNSLIDLESFEIRLENIVYGKCR